MYFIVFTAIYCVVVVTAIYSICPFLGMNYVITGSAVNNVISFFSINFISTFATNDSVIIVGTINQTFTGNINSSMYSFIVTDKFFNSFILVAENNIFYGVFLIVKISVSDNLTPSRITDN